MSNNKSIELAVQFADIKILCSVGCLNALGAFPSFVLAVTDKTEVTTSAALTESLGADEVGVGQVAIVDDVGVAEHRTEAVKDTVT